MAEPQQTCGHLMLISPQRVFYAGLLGRPRGRTSGSLLIYVAFEGALTLTQAGERNAGVTTAVVAPYIEHSIASEHRCVICLTIEPETVHPDALAQVTQMAKADDFAARVRDGYRQLLDGRRGDALSACAFDTLFFGAPLPARKLDPRIASALVRLDASTPDGASAADCARAANLSQSRFLHLFKDETGTSFRAMRAYKRARHLLHYVNASANFAHLAQDIGYPDSTHFSHSIRRFYGLKPRSIFVGSRDLEIIRSVA